MDISPRTRVLKNMTTECLRQVRAVSRLPAAEAEAFLQDLPAKLMEWHESLMHPQPDSFVSEQPALQGYSLWASTYDDDQNNRVILAEEEHIWDMIGPVLGKRVLDAGAGTGRHAVRLANSGATVVASEPNATLLAMAESKAVTAPIEWLSHDIETLPEHLGKFDLVLCCLVLSHVKDIDVAIHKLSFFVADGGSLIVSDFHPFNLMIGWRTSFVYQGRKYVVPNYLHLPSTYYGAFQRAGLVVEQFKEVGDYPQLPDQPATLLMKARKPNR